MSEMLANEAVNAKPPEALLSVVSSYLQQVHFELLQTYIHVVAVSVAFTL